MKRGLLIIATILVAPSCWGQWSPSFKPLRYNEDYSFIDSLASKNWYDKTKFTPLNKNATSYLSFGGDIRFQYFFYKNEGWGEVPNDPDGFILNRFLFHSDVHLGNRLRFFVQLQGSGASSNENPSPIDENPLDLHQLFLEFKSNLSKKAGLKILVGRQELLYGAQRLISVREGPNTRNAFDSFKAIVTLPGTSIDLFYGQYVIAKPGIFDDEMNDAVQVWGAYMVRNNLPLVENLDVYYLGLKKKEATFDDGTGEELRHSGGLRIWGEKGDWFYNIEGLYQFGSLAQNDISAWTLSADISYTFSRIKSSPEIGVKTEIISGDQYREDGGLQTFNPMFPRGAYFGLAAFIGPSNLIDVHPSIEIMLTRNVSWSVDFDVFWRNQRSDGIYAPNVELIYSGLGSNSKFIGSQLGNDFKFRISPFVSATAELTWFDAGDFIKDVGPGRDILFIGATLQLKF